MAGGRINVFSFRGIAATLDRTMSCRDASLLGNGDRGGVVEGRARGWELSWKERFLEDGELDLELEQAGDGWLWRGRRAGRRCRDCPGRFHLG